MRIRNLLAALPFMAAGLQTAWAQGGMLVWQNGKHVGYRVSEVDSVQFVSNADRFISSDYVDLALPSGTLWATCNVGASSPEEYGDYFAWGETEPKGNYTWGTYRYSGDTETSMTKYCTDSSYGRRDGRAKLGLEDDAAAANWGGDWAMPTFEQMNELTSASNTTMEWTTVNGIGGYRITSKRNGKSIFLPAAGYRYQGSRYMSYTYYWTSTLLSSKPNSARVLYFYSASGNAYHYMSDKQRYLGHPVRPVKGMHDYVEIGGLKWATMNVGATTVSGSCKTCFGDYYAWGETEPRYSSVSRTSADKASFTWKSSYSSGYSSDNYPTYTGTMLDASHDAATANWGGTWRTPTKAEYEALAMACSGSSSNGQTPVTLTSTITVGGIYWLSSTQTIEPAYTGVAGILFVDREDIDNRVFFPASGYVYDTSLSNGGTYGYYWSSSLYTSNTNSAYSLFFSSSLVFPSYDYYRYRGFTVRPVSD